MEKFLSVIKTIASFLMTFIIFTGGIFVLAVFLGVSPYIIKSGSMEKAVGTGSLVFVNKNFEYEKIKTGDIVAFQVSSGEIVVHRALNVYLEGIETKGDANKVSDGITVTKQNYIGKVVLSVPKLGYLFSSFQTVRGKLVFGIFIFVIFLAGVLNGK